MVVSPAQSADTWCAIMTDPIPVSTAFEWAAIDSCGAVVTFCGTVRNHSEDRPGVVHLEYECYEEYAIASLERVASDARVRWPSIGRVALLHRIARLEVGETTVAVVVSAPHRDEAFDAARFCIDTVKGTAPIWKRESWAGGSAWATCHVPLVGEGSTTR